MKNRKHQDIVVLAAYCTKGRVKHKVNYSTGKYHRFVKGNAKRFIMFLLGAKEIGKWLVNSLGTRKENKILSYNHSVLKYDRTTEQEQKYNNLKS